MITAVLDANSIVSATLSQRSAPHQLVLAARARLYQMVTSTVIIAEVLRALAGPRIQRRYRLSASDVDATRSLLVHEARTTPLTATVQGVASHPEDDLVLATAISGQVDYLVTFDRQLLRLGIYQGVRIVSPHQFLTILRSQSEA